MKVERAQLLECFRKFDTGGTGSIRFEDVLNVLPSITEAEWADVVSAGGAAGAIDAVSAAELTFEDFVALLEPSTIQQECGPSCSAAAA